ncbi:MAG: NADH-ubiquinone oxidoreductase-F iron-sulfur binding region domain-containing protein [Anaerolineaceae bacterium]|nr:NADH-ubiquinone oxidoreductase-F iron-sulfur binding region domain-containing protein [Anaerolineaceae bacterium]
MVSLEEQRSAAQARWSERTQGELPVIYVGTASCGQAAGALETLEAARDTLAELEKEAHIVEVGCIGPCYLEPLMDVALPGQPRICYATVTPAKAKKILTACLTEGDLLPKLAKGHFGAADFTRRTGIQRFFDLPMLKPQVRIILKNCGLIDPEDFDAALATGAYHGLERALSLGPQRVIAELKEAGLRGRGGAGFSTGKKWEITAAATGSAKYVICNADEGDPGAFMNRALLESDPHAVLEGMLISGLAIGAHTGIVYARAEYPLAVERLRKAVGQMRSAGLLGENILGTGFSFDIRIQEGAGAFVCGEETALIASLEGQRGMPRPRPPFPAEHGYHGQPTLINNTETFGSVPAILREGGTWYRQFGTSTNPGTKTFSLVGKARHTGLIEIPLGMTLRQVVEEIGGGTRLPFKAIQTGGPLGGCLPAEQLDTPITYETMRELGSMMGSGGLIVMDEDTCMVDMARYFIGFAQSESCGNCTPCRNGTRILADTLERITHGEGEPEDVDILRRASQTMASTSLCGLGQAAANPVLSSLRYFRDEYETHIQDSFCSPAVCTELFEYTILAERCTGCDLCKAVCETNAIQGERRMLHTLDAALCIKCKACVRVCAQRAITGAPVEMRTQSNLVREMA